MRFGAWLGLAVVATALLVGAEGCSSAAQAGSGSGVRCTPGNYVFCRCADRAEGTKLCKADGQSFEACMTSANGECIGGEDLTDPGTGVEVPAPDSGSPPQEGGTGSPIDACPGKPTAVIPGASLLLSDDTTSAASDYKGKVGACAAGDGGPDHVYHLQPTGSGSLAVQVQGEGALNALVYLRSTCTDEQSQLACAPPLGAGKLVQLQANLVAGHDYYLVVDGASGSAGKYTVSAKLTTGSFCGDGRIDSGEACDDANKTDGDGCANNCKGVAGDPAAADCTTPHPVHMWKGATVTGTGSNTAYGNTFTKPGTSCDPAIGSNLAPDHIYEVTAHSAGTLKVTLTPTEGTFNVQLVARTTCSDAASQAGDTGSMCNAQSAGVAETITVPVAADQKIYVAADGAMNAQGTYTIKFELP